MTYCDQSVFLSESSDLEVEEVSSELKLGPRKASL